MIFSTNSLRAVSVSGLAGVLLLTACGGSYDPFDGIAKGFAEGISCGLTNCKESAELSPGEIAIDVNVTQKMNGISVTATLHKSLNVFTAVRLSQTDGITVSLNGRNIPLSDISQGERLKFSGLLADNSTQALANIQFQRGNEYFPASVTLPAPFSILSPSGPVNLNRSAGKLRVQLSRDVSNGVYISLSLQCRRTDGSSFTDITDFNPRLDNDAYRIDTAELDLVLNERSRTKNNQKPETAAVANCDIDMDWTNYVRGNVSNALNKYSSVRGQYAVTQRVYYDART